MSDLSRRESLKCVAAVGLAGVAGIAWGQEQPPRDFWRAWAVTEGAETSLVVEGIYGEGGPGMLALVTAAAPQGINPKILILEVKTATLPGIWTAVLRPVPAHYRQSPYKAGQYDSVEVRYPDGGSATIRTIVDTGQGPGTE